MTLIIQSCQGCRILSRNENPASQLHGSAAQGQIGGDAEPSNLSSLVHGTEMRAAEGTSIICLCRLG